MRTCRKATADPSATYIEAEEPLLGPSGSAGEAPGLLFPAPPPPTSGNASTVALPPQKKRGTQANTAATGPTQQPAPLLPTNPSTTAPKQQPATRLPPATPNATANPQRKRTKSTNKIDAVGVPPEFERPHNPNEDIVWLTDACGGDFKSWAYALQGSTTVICFFCDTHKESNATISHTNWDRSAYTRHEASHSHKAAVDQYTQDQQQQQTDKHLAMTEVADNPLLALFCGAYMVLYQAMPFTHFPTICEYMDLLKVPNITGLSSTRVFL
ncbi:hypothetical protein VOLCADRAFT_99076 [Volvox carteri f. nagariensis]|uniref:Uncharacterized protein n=1 Tax=Volvox carteri f. nagariensis TaxID=3068 RepID=D8UGZ4_VOLCA|nr:uncharacterized protein VOLCADRAFT_99076 [Volvox carteri f. nagariensis]EFJ40982.1 hypothetical protein VOLCADRAFT_99076 [Volvox carteri f. nagariensis]|eukprot:XP_002957956.1 hypothetical protein VOLCADRAFT_99076 [Volvox carteri f. nagariensis]